VASKKLKKRRVVTKQVVPPPSPVIQRPVRNGQCPCGSGKKFKKCCQNVSLLPAPTAVPVSTTKFPRSAACSALLSARVSPACVWAYFKTGVYITETTRHLHPNERLEEWDLAVDCFNYSAEAEQQTMLNTALS
jgi:hypothetical protein